jgi:hypothetical protein
MIPLEKFYDLQKSKSRWIRAAIKPDDTANNG